MSRTEEGSAYLTEQEAAYADELAAILEALQRPQKSISPKYFYDDRGSRLFDRITELPEYYPTRTELAIMERYADEMADLIGPQASLIEFGSGSSQKIRILLDHVDRLAAYVPVDISKDHLVAAANTIATDFPSIEVLPVAADFTQPFDLPNPAIPPVRNVVYFPGSTIGNFSPSAARELLKVMHHEAGDGGALLIGIDLRKNRQILEQAYNDASGVTAEFNLNVLNHLNREFGADFDLGSFRHSAIYNETDGRIEMYLVSLREQVVSVASESIDIAAGERILTEHSHKYDLQEFSQSTREVGFRCVKFWTDPDDMFAVCFFERE